MAKKATKKQVSRLAQFGVDAVQTLAEVMDDPRSSAEAQVAAASAILEFIYRGVEQDLLERLERLERAQGNL